MVQRLFASDRAMRLLAPLFGPFHPWQASARADPYPLYRRLREQGRLLRSPALGAWVAPRFDECEQILRDRSFSADRNRIPLFRLVRWQSKHDRDFLNFLDHNLLNLDAPAHTRLRGLVSKAFTPRRVRALSHRTEALVDELLGGVDAGSEVELIRSFAGPLPVRVIMEMLGLPEADRGFFQHCSDGLAELLDPFSGREGLAPPRRATAELATYFREALAARRREPGDDLLSAMVEAEDANDRLGEGEILALCTLLLVAGHETTVNLIGNAVLALLRFPEERRRLVEEPELVEPAIDEFLRFDGPVQFTDRVVAEPCQLAGRHLERGDFVIAVLASANRDESRFEASDRLDVGRADRQHLALGGGSHFCLGASLARMETAAALRGLLERFPEFVGDPEATRFRRSAALRGPVHLPLKLR